MASTRGCNFLMYRALDEPNSAVIVRSTDRLIPVKKFADRFPNLFQEFHCRICSEEIKKRAKRLGRLDVSAHLLALPDST